MSLLRCSACFLVLLFFTFCSVNCKGTAAGHDLRTWSRESGAVARSLKSIVEQYTIDLTVGDAAFVGNRHLLQEKPKDEADEASEETDTKSDKKKDEVSDETDTKSDKKKDEVSDETDTKSDKKKDEVSDETDAKSNKKKDEVEEKPDESDSKAKTDDMTMEEEKIEAKTKTETKMNTKTDTEDKAEAEPPTEAETEPEPKTKTKKNTAAKTKKEAKADPETDVEDGSDVEAEGDGEEAKKIVKTNSDKKEDSDAKSGEGKKSSMEKDGKSVDDVPEKEKIEAEAETEPEAEDKDVAKTKVVEKVSAKKKGKSKAESDAEEKDSSTNKDTKPEENSKKAGGAKIKADTVEKAEEDDSPDEGEETDPVTKKGDKKSKVNNVKKEKKNKKNILKKEKKKEPKTVEPKTVEPKTVEPKTVEPKTVEPKKKPTPVVVKKVQPTVPSDCVWNNDSKSCFVDKKPFSKILSKAKSKSGKVLLQEYECLDLDQVSCNKMDGCEWLGSCQSTSYIKAQNKCFGSGSGFIYHLDGTCDTHSEQSACSLNDKCMWLSDMQKCAVDFVKAFTGVSIDGQEVQNTRSSRNSDLQATFNANVGNFVNNPDSILDWTLPDFNCPDGVEPTVCEFAMVFDREFVLNKHCGAKYDITDISECNLDPLCEIGIDAACGISPVMRNEVARSGSEVLANAAKSSLGTQYIELINACQKGPSNVEGVGCEPGCLLDENSCIVDTDTFIQQTVFKSKSFKGGQCKGFPLVLGDSGCKDLNEKACQAKKECSLDGDDVCIPNKKEKILGALLELERPVASAAKAATKKCGSFKTKSKCEMPKVL